MKVKSRIVYLSVLFAGMLLFASCTDEVTGKLPVVTLPETNIPALTHLNVNFNKTKLDEVNPIQEDSLTSAVVHEEFTSAGTYLGDYFPPVENFQPSEPIDLRPSPIVLPNPMSTQGCGIPKVIDFPECEAEYTGGRLAMMQFLQANLVYPLDQTSYSATIYISFIVEVDGSLTNVEVIRGVSKELDLEAKRLIRTMPKWQPAEDLFGPCRSRVRFPIHIHLQ